MRLKNKRNRESKYRVTQYDIILVMTGRPRLRGISAPRYLGIDIICKAKAILHKNR